MIAMCDLQCTPAPRHWAGVSGVCRGAQTRVFRGKIISVCRRARRAHEPTQHNTFKYYQYAIEAFNSLGQLVKSKVRYR